MTRALVVENLTVTFPSEEGRVEAVHDVSFSVDHGHLLGLVGESGSGKSTVALAILGLLPETARVTGRVLLDGHELLGLGDAELSRIRGRSMAIVFQDPLSALTPVYSIGDQIVEALRVHQKIAPSSARHRAIELLDLVGVPDAQRRFNAFPHEFSGGMRQRVMIAMAIANDPQVIIADEPTTALDVTIQAQILEVLKTAQEVTGAAILMITHDLGVVAGLADQVAVMYAGRLVEMGSVDEIYSRPRMPYTIGLLHSIPRLEQTEKAPLATIEGKPPSLVRLPSGCPFNPRCPIAIPLCKEQKPELVSASPDSHPAACHRRQEIESGDLPIGEIFPMPEVPSLPIAHIPREHRKPVLKLDQLIKHFPLLRGAVFKRQVGTVRAVDGVSIDVREGETVGLVGESGCGKTTVLLEILELAVPQSGSITLFERDTRKLNEKDSRQLRGDLQVVFQDPLASLDPRMPIGDILAEPLRTHGWESLKIRWRIGELLRLVGLDSGHAVRYPQELSGGQRQRVCIARALALGPRLLLLDEPVSALDVSIQAGIINLLDDLKARLGLSYLFVSHDLSVIQHIADRVAVMYLGRIVEVGEVAAIYARPSHPYTQALLSAIPIPDPVREKARHRILLQGDLPSPAEVPSGCRFRPRCPKYATLDEAAARRCREEDPRMYTLEGDHQAACHYAAPISVV